MPSEEIAGNEGALARLRALLGRDRPAHAYLFSGPEGVGKKRAALEFARALGARTFVVERAGDRHELVIGQVHEVIRELHFASRERRAVILDDAHRMSEEAMNACLKTLEEPPAGTVLILVTSVPDRLLGTIRSRCHAVLFCPLTEEEMEAYARGNLGLDEPAAGAVAVLSGGSVGAARTLAPEIGEVVAAARDLQARVLSGELNPVGEALGRIRDTEQARRAARRNLSLLAACLREVLRSKHGKAPRLATPAFVDRYGRLDEDEILERIETLLDHERMIDLNAGVVLAVEDALLRL